MDDLFDQEQPFDEYEEYEQEEAPTPPVSAPKRRGLDSSKDALAMYKELQEATIKGLYRDDPLIREGLNAQVASELMKQAAAVKKASNLNYDAQGNLTGVSKSVMGGVHATDKNRKDLLKAIQADIYKKLGVEHGK